MRITGRARRLRIYIGDSDQWHHQPLSLAILELLKREGLAGATVLRGVAGFGAHSRIHTRALLDLSTDLPVVIEVVDRPDRIERILPRLEEMVVEGLITDEEVIVRVYRHRELRPLSEQLLVRDLMTRAVVSVTPATPLTEVIERLRGQLFRALPVVDAAGRVVGIVTSGDLVARGGLPARLRLVRDLADHAPARPGSTAGEIMTAPPVMVRDDQPAAEALHLLVSHRLKRLPVVDAAGRLVGMLSRVDLLRAIVDSYGGIGEEETRRVGGASVADIMRRDPATVTPDTPVPDVVDALLAAPTHRVLVTDAAERLLGIVSDADVLAHLEPSQRPALLAWLSSRSDAERQTRQLSRLRAVDVMNTQVVTIGPEATLAQAIGRSLEHRRHVLPVVESDGRVLGLISRAELLAALATEPTGER